MIAFVWEKLLLAWNDLLAMSGSQARAWFVVIVLFGVIPVMGAKMWMMRIRRLRQGDLRAAAPFPWSYVPLNRKEVKSWLVALLVIPAVFVVLLLLTFFFEWLDTLS